MTKFEFLHMYHSAKSKYSKYNKILILKGPRCEQIFCDRYILRRTIMETSEMSTKDFFVSNYSRTQIDTHGEDRETESRARPRQQIYSECKYQFPSDTHCRNCILANISEFGAFIIVENRLPIGSLINIKIESENAEEQAITFLCTIVREEIQPDVRQFGYGCRILDKDDDV